MKPIILLPPRISDDSIKIWRAALALGYSPYRIQNWRIPDEFKSECSEQNIAIYGEPLFAEAIADQLNYALLEPSIDWLPSLPEKYTRRKISLTTLEEARHLDHRIFVKPAEGKIFEAQVYESGKELPNEDTVDLDIEVLISEIVDFKLEVRCFVHHRKIVDLSPYWRDGSLAQDQDESWPFLATEKEDAIRFASLVLNYDNLLPPSCTLDVGKLPSGEWAVIEANPSWGAGLYGCIPENVLPLCSDAFIPHSEVTEVEEQWVSKRRSTYKSKQ